MRHIEMQTLTLRGTHYTVSEKITRQVEKILEKAKVNAATQDRDWIPIEAIYPDIDHPIKGPANYLRGIRSREGLTQTQLAQKVGMKQSHISEMERYKRPIGKVAAQKLAKALNANWRNMLSE